MSVIHGGSAIGNLDVAPAFERRNHHEEIGGAIALVLIIDAGRASRSFIEIGTRVSAMLVLLVPREMKVEHSGGVKAMTDEQIEQAIEAIQGMLAARAAGEGAKVIDAVPEPVALPAPSRKPRRKRGVEVLPDEQGESE